MAEQKTSLDELKQEMKDFLKIRKKSVENHKKIEAPLKKKLIEEITKQVSAFIKMYEGKDIEDGVGNLIIVDKDEIYSEDYNAFEITFEEETNRFSDDGDSEYNVLIGLTKDGQYQYVNRYSSPFGSDESDPEYDKLSNLSIDNLVEILDLFPLEVNVLSEEEEEDEE